MKNATPQQKGQMGEEAAARHYGSMGFALREKNFKTRFGEVDLVVQKGDLLVFVEVKTRSQGAQVPPAQAVDAHKQRRLVAAAKGWMQQHPAEDLFMRFDVAEVLLADEGGGVAAIHIIDNAFTL